MSFGRWRASGREAAVIGLGKSGVAASLLLRREGIPVYASDSARELVKGAERDPAADRQAYALAERLRLAGVEFQVGVHDLDRIARAGVCVASPGVPPEAPPLEAARRGGVQIVSELDVGAAGLPSTHFAVITGTNGKTTTTALTGELLSGAGFRAITAGNIGNPLSEVALGDNHPEWIALEISSFQLHDTYDLVPAIGAVTNLAPDHLDRYARLEDYYADKDLIYRRASASSCWVTNADDPEVQRRAAGRRGTQLRFSVQQPADANYDRLFRHLYLQGSPLLPRNQLMLLGDHNVANALCAALIAQRAGVERPLIVDGLRRFRALPHRLEPIREVNGVLWLNDSKATNVASTMVAVEALDRPFVLLLGGRHKGEPYTALAAAAGDRCRAVIAFGESRDRIIADLTGRLPVTPAGTDFEQVLSLAARAAQPGDAVLLSPACSSYDMFKNYEDRGAQFRAAVERM